MNHKAISRARTKERPKAKLSQTDIDSIVAAIVDGSSYYAAGKKYGVSGAAARYHWRRWIELQERDA